MTARSRMRTLWAADPVKYWRAAPHTSGRTVEVDLEAVPGPDRRPGVAEGGDLGHLGSSVKALATAAGSAAAARRSMSWTAAFMRRSDPATSTRSTPATPASSSEGLGQGQGHGQGDAVHALGHPLQGAAQVGLGARPHPGHGHPPGGDRLGQLLGRGDPEPLVDQAGLAGPRPGTRTRARRPGGPAPAAPPAWRPGRCRGTRGPWRRSPCRPRGWRPAPLGQGGQVGPVARQGGRPRS